MFIPPFFGYETQTTFLVMGNTRESVETLLNIWRFGQGRATSSGPPPLPHAFFVLLNLMHSPFCGQQAFQISSVMFCKLPSTEVLLK